MKSIKSKLINLAMAAIVAVLVVGFLTAAIFVQVKQKALSVQTGEYLAKSLDQQADSILLGYLLPEQRSGIDLLLEDTRRSEDLSQILVYEGDPPAEFKGCKSAAVCLSQDGRETAVVRAIKDGPKIYGTLLKAKSNRNALIEDLVYRGIFFITLAVSAVLAMMLILFALILNRDISDSLARLLKGLQDGLKGNFDHLSLPAKYREFSDLQKSIYVLLEEHRTSQQYALVAELASQVAHDIRSPLTALQMASGDSAEMTEERRVLIRNATSRIRDIANDLISKYKSRGTTSPEKTSDPKTGIQLIPALIESLVSEKRISLQGQDAVTIDIVLEPSAYGSFVSIETASFKRAISNLLNNAVEAIEAKGKVEVRIASSGNDVRIVISDNGRGIPADVLRVIGTRDLSYGKDNIQGTGLGVHQAQAAIQRCNGRIVFKSEKSVGTTVTVHLPKSEPPAWFVSEIEVSRSRPIVIVDDDKSIHDLWQNRMSTSKTEASLTHFSSTADFRTWYKSQETAGLAQALYLVDCEYLKGTENGIDLINDLGISKNSILVTSRFEDPAVLAGCLRSRILLLPKPMAIFVPLR